MKIEDLRHLLISETRTTDNGHILHERGQPKQYVFTSLFFCSNYSSTNHEFIHTFCRCRIVTQQQNIKPICQALWDAKARNVAPTYRTVTQSPTHPYLARSFHSPLLRTHSRGARMRRSTTRQLAGRPAQLMYE